MNVLLIVCLVFLGIYSCVSWLLPAVLAWLFKRKYHVKLKIGRIVVPKLILKDVSLSKDRYVIHIKEVSFKSSFFNSEINKLVSVIIKDLEISNHVEERRSIVVETILKPLLSKQNSTSSRHEDDCHENDLCNLNSALENIVHGKLLDFRDKKLPQKLILFAQFMGIHIFNASVSWEGAGWAARGAAAEAHADGAAGGPARALVFSLSAAGARGRLRAGAAPVAEFSCGLLVEGTVKADGPLNVEKIHTSVTYPTLVIQEGLSDLAARRAGAGAGVRAGAGAVPAVGVDPLDDVVVRLAPVIPKIFSLRVDDVRLSCVEKVTKTHFQLSIQSVQVNSRFSAGEVGGDGGDGGSGGDGSGGVGGVRARAQLYVAVQLQRPALTTNVDLLASLDKLKLDAKLENGTLHLYVILGALAGTYRHEEALPWRRALRRAPALRVHRQPDECAEARVPRWLSYFLSSCAVCGCAELVGARLSLRAARRTASVGAAGLKLKLDQTRETRDDTYTHPYARLLLGSRHWSAELLLDGGWVQAPAPPGPAPPAPAPPGPEPPAPAPPASAPPAPAAPPRRAHAWGSAMLAAALLKWGSVQHGDCKVEAMIDSLRFEWSQSLADAIVEIAASVADLTAREEPAPMRAPSTPSNVSMTIALSNFNVFAIASEHVCLMTRVDAASLECAAGRASAVVTGVKLVDMVPYEAPVPCKKYSDLHGYFFDACMTKIEYVRDATAAPSLDVELSQVFDVQWSPNIHLKALTLIRNFNEFRRALKGDGDTKEQPKTERHIDWSVTLKDDVALSLILKQENKKILNSIKLTTDELWVSGRGSPALRCARLALAVDGAGAARAAGLRARRQPHDPAVRVEREANEGFVLHTNRVWDVSVDSVRVVFPYQHRFAETVQGELVTVVKWLKEVHGVAKRPFTADSPLPSDLFIKIQDILIEMSDDPFEVKLRDNYELLEDEYKESLKRRAMLEAKIQELCRPHLFLPAGKVEELYAALREKDAQIYVQRSRAAPPPRTRLLACCVSALQLVACADPSLHGRERTVDKLRGLDHDTNWDDASFATLWARSVTAACAQWTLQLRDFPQPLLQLTRLRLWGLLLAAEETAPPRALRPVSVAPGAPWPPHALERSMMPLKWYYDLCCEMTDFSYAFGPCWEPVVAQCNLALDLVFRPSLDPSAPLAWWDKVRLLLHGRLTARAARCTCLLHVSLDPYNTTEEMEVTWNDLVLDWTNGKLGFLGDLNVLVRTASKYDDCRVLRVPALRLRVALRWRCLSPDHRVPPCAPERRPEYSSHQEHDSYRAFRSAGLELALTLDTRPSPEGPVLLLYGSTLRWFESLKLILSGVTRPTRRGRVFGNLRARRPQLSRHYRAVSAALTLHNVQVFYWSSSSMQRGVELLGARVTCGSKYTLSLVPNTDGLVRRPRADWSTAYMNCDLNDVEIWLKSACQSEEKSDGDHTPTSATALLDKCYCVSVRRAAYSRSAAGADGPSRRLCVRDLRGAWTQTNRELAGALLDTYIKTQQLKKNLSTKALKEEEAPADAPGFPPDDAPPPPAQQCFGPGAGDGSLLARLVAGAGGEAPVVFSDELAPTPPPRRAPDALDHTAVLIELINSQVVLKGRETRGYVVVCAARAEVTQRTRRAPRATAWAGALSAMQYYATGAQLENIQWVNIEQISERRADEISSLPDVPRLVGSGHSAGGVIGSTVGPSTTPQLQRIVSRCACEFYYVSHEEAPRAGDTQPPEPYDSFTLTHHDLDVSTNSLQYAMLLDVINNVVLYVEPERRRTLERRARTRFQLQLARDADPRALLHKLQTQVRESLARLRRLEKEYYLKNRALSERDPAAAKELRLLDKQVNECKESVWSLGDDLDAMVRAWRSRRLAPRRPADARVREHEICFQSARWRLTAADGQLGVADLLLTNFLYTKTSNSDESVEHQLEVGYVRVANLLPNEPFPEVLVPQAPSGRAPLARRAALRVFCRDRPSVGGIAVKEHFEVNIVPIKIGLTKKFFNTMLKFCFPERDPDNELDDEEERPGSSAGLGPRPGSSSSLVQSSKKTKKKTKDSNSNFYVKRDMKNKDDVEKMKERAEKNKLFIYIKIPEVPLRLSYKGSKEKNLEDVRDLPLVLPTLEYHNVTWTWLDLLLATKSDTRRVILSQAIRQKLQLHRRAAAAPEPQEEDKARLLLGQAVTDKPQKKGVPNVFKFSKS